MELKYNVFILLFFSSEIYGPVWAPIIWSGRQVEGKGFQKSKITESFNKKSLLLPVANRFCPLLTGVSRKIPVDFWHSESS